MFSRGKKYFPYYVTYEFLEHIYYISIFVMYFRKNPFHYINPSKDHSSIKILAFRRMGFVFKSYDMKRPDVQYESLLYNLYL